jgi:hypothetical protein
MKTIKSLMVLALLAVGIGATVMLNTTTTSTDWSQAWEENGVGPFDAIGMSWVSGETFANLALTSTLCQVTELGAFSCSGGYTPTEEPRTPAEQFALSTPVPEPETYSMVLAGLGLMGFIARRRKQKEAAAA